MTYCIKLIDHPSNKFTIIYNYIIFPPNQIAFQDEWKKNYLRFEKPYKSTQCEKKWMWANFDTIFCLSSQYDLTNLSILNIIKTGTQANEQASDLSLFIIETIHQRNGHTKYIDKLNSNLHETGNWHRINIKLTKKRFCLHFNLDHSIE